MHCVQDLAAGRLCNNDEMIEQSFRTAFHKMKPTDAALVSFFPVFRDELAMDAAFVRKYGVRVDNGARVT